ncbi:MAG: hypothetical protein QNK40_06110 [Desulfobacterales bacterium]|nr:hypothetical protein [Desulfobacterales bacterium]MDX2508851.1 hypothetical protein [Desulfobacterales bacterium]
MNFKYHLETAWNMTLKFIAPLIFITLVMFLLWFFTIGILAPVTMAGYMHSILLMLRDGREPKIQDLFTQMKLFLPLLGFSILVFIATVIGFMLLVLPGIVISLVISFCCLYMLPLMTDKELGLFEAVKESYTMTTRGVFTDQIVVLILFLGISAVGSAVFIGSLFTQPLATIFLLSVYEEKIKQPPQIKNQ